MVAPYNYYTVQGWMVTELGLKGNELAAYAIIYGFSQDGQSEFFGSRQYISEWLGCSRRHTLTILNSLVEKGLLARRIVGDGVSPNAYIAIQPKNIGGENISPGVGKNDAPGGEDISPGVGKNDAPGGEDISPNNNIKDIDFNNKKIDSAPPAKTRHKYGEYQNVLLTDDEREKLEKDYPDLEERIERLSEYIASTGKSYKSHYATIRAWARRDPRTAPTRSQQTQRYYGGRQVPQGAELGPNGVLIDRTQQADGLPW